MSAIELICFLQPQLFISSNEHETARSLKSYSFKKNMNDIPINVLIVWGLKPRDMSSCDPRYYKAFHPCPGIGVYDDKFDLEKEANQLAMKVKQLQNQVLLK